MQVELTVNNDNLCDIEYTQGEQFSAGKNILKKSWFFLLINLLVKR
jgi:hypothetical protein